MTSAFIVCDLGFGDAGKGLVTDALVRATGAPVVVRYNGGAQAGHNVVTADGRHHTFSQLGAGSFVPGVQTFLTRDVLVHPTALLNEAAHFDGSCGAGASQSVLERVWLSERAKVITPFHQALNRLRELARGDAVHGSCGVGVGETVRDALESPGEILEVGTLPRLVELRRVLARARERLLPEARELARQAAAHPAAALELAIFERPEVSQRWQEALAPLLTRKRIVSDAHLGALANDGQALIFEGAQGVLLDERHGFHPHTTWSDCTPHNAERLLGELGLSQPVVRVGVLRSHAVRHGPGPFPSETNALDGLVDEHNARNDWQGHVRYGWFDEVLARYALERIGGVHHLALTHLDLLARRGSLSRVVRYRGRVETHANHWSPGEEGQRLRPPAHPSLEYQETLGAFLSSGLIPELVEASDERAFLEGIERALGAEVALCSRGPSAASVELRGSLAASLWARSSAA